MASRTIFEHAYRLYRDLVNRLAEQGPESAATALADACLGRRDEKQLHFQAQYHDLAAALEEAWSSVVELRSISLNISGGRQCDDPLPDVYAAALSMRMGD